MSKEITCDVLKVYSTVDSTEYVSTNLAEISWNKRPVSGVDIRKYDKTSDRYSKGITVSYTGFSDMVCDAVKAGLVNMDDLDDAVKSRKNKVFSSDDFSNLFKKVQSERNRYHRDQYGMLRDDNDNYVIASRRMKK